MYEVIATKIAKASGGEVFSGNSLSLFAVFSTKALAHCGVHKRGVHEREHSAITLQIYSQMGTGSLFYSSYSYCSRSRLV